MTSSKDETTTDPLKKQLKKPVKKSRASHVEDMVDHYWGSINYIMSLIQASELKAGLLLSFYGILLNFMYQKMEEIFTIFPNNIPLYILLGLWFACTVVSIFYCIRCFIPRIEAKYDKNIFFFGDVITKFGGIKDFSRTFYETSLDEEQLFDQLGQQIFIISKITARKFKNVNKALRFLAWGILVLLITIVYYAVLMAL
ncbi:DUF5706 domain-containing protein [Arenibacter sp. GZD96]|uniref:Pycsar system effector family protein n=1 Tax=Aurantibrevibacter litoralis TaxID=3106030 RepID=UPI002AFFE7DC|nr:Pycsar system effector family protein [Arenibacter sp. GZD-96]MEA1786052.1 DUF5706 domain-containing protein [Arenibacter sp. GZD-96]